MITEEHSQKLFSKLSRRMKRETSPSKRISLFSLSVELLPWYHNVMCLPSQTPMLQNVYVHAVSPAKETSPLRLLSVWFLSCPWFSICHEMFTGLAVAHPFRREVIILLELGWDFPVCIYLGIISRSKLVHFKVPCPSFSRNHIHGTLC